MMGSFDGDDDEDWLKAAPVRTTTDASNAASKSRQRKLISLDDILLLDHKESVRKLKPKPKSMKVLQNLRKKAHLYSSSEEDDDESKDDQQAPKLLEDLESQVKTEVGEEVDAEWGQAVFGAQLPAPSLLVVEDGEGAINRALRASKGSGKKTSMELLASSGFLRSWTLCCGHCDELTLRWTYHQMAYSREESAEWAACKLLCDVVTRSAMDSGSAFKLDWLPSLADFKETLRVYGYEREGPKGGEPMDTSVDGSVGRLGEEQGPPKNLRSLLEFIVACFETRKLQQRYTYADVEALLVIMVRLTLERRIHGIMRLVQECIMVLVHYFSNEVWATTCVRVASSISELTTEVHNGVYLVGALSGTGTRVLQLQQKLALRELTKSVKPSRALSSPREVAKLFDAVNVKAKVLDFGKLYYQVVLADTYFWGNEDFRDKVALYKWLLFLRSCSIQIFIGDERPFATKVRNRASFLVQKYEHEGIGKESSPERETEDEYP